MRDTVYFTLPKYQITITQKNDKLMASYCEIVTQLSSDMIISTLYYGMRNKPFLEGMYSKITLHTLFLLKIMPPQTYFDI